MPGNVLLFISRQCVTGAELSTTHPTVSQNEDELGGVDGWAHMGWEVGSKLLPPVMLCSDTNAEWLHLQ